MRFNADAYFAGGGLASLSVKKNGGGESNLLERKQADMDPRKALMFGETDQALPPMGLPIGQAVGTKAAVDLAKGVIDASDLTRQAMQGELPPDYFQSDEGIGRALNAAGIGMAGGVAGVPARAGETVLGSGPVRKALDVANQAAYERQLTPLGFYSHGAETAANLAQAKGAPDQMAAMLQKYGVKPDEMYATGFANESATAAARSKIEAEFAPRVAEAQRAMEGLEPGTPEFKAAERQFKNISSTMRSEMDRALVLGDEWSARPSVTRDEIAAHFKERMPQIEETVLGGKQPFDVNRLKELEKEYAGLKQHPIDDPSFGEEKYNELIQLMNIRDQSSTQSLYDAADQATRSGQRAQRQGNNVTAEKYFREAEFLNTRAEKLDLEGKGLPNPTKFNQYTLPGGENYREVLLKLPDESGALRKETAEAKSLRTQAVADYANAVPGSPEAVEAQDRIKKYTKIHTDLINNSTNLPPEFRSGHWDDPNVLAHLRMADRTGPNGEKILHVEEIQSDWGQKGKKEGFKEQNKSNLSVNNEGGIWRVRDPQGQRVDLDGVVGFGSEEQARNAIAANTRDIGGVPSAPYVTNTQAWTDLALKRALREAAEGGYDKLVWTPGAEQAKRYKLSNHVNSIDYMREGEDAYRLGITNKQGEGIDLPKDTFTAKELEEYLGKEVAQKIVDDEGKAYRGRNHKTLEGLDLEVGGKGMKGYYDKIVPTQLSKLVKKLDPEAKVAMENIPVARKSSKEFIPSGPKMENAPQSYDFPSLTITPKMREAIMKGQTAYAEGGKVKSSKSSVGHPSAHIALVSDIRKTAKEHGMHKPAMAHLINMMGIDKPRAAAYAQNILSDPQLHNKIDPVTEKFLITLNGAMKHTAAEKHKGELRRHLRDRVIYGNP